MAPAELDGYDIGRRAFLALVADLPEVALDSALARALSERPAEVREALARWVPRVAFVLGARARGLLESEPERLFSEWFEPLPELGRLGNGPARAVLAELSRGETQGSFDPEFEPEALGSFYEGTLGAGLALAREPTAVLRPRRRVGDAALEAAVGLSALAALPGTKRVAALAELGVELDAHLARVLARGRTPDELGALLTESRITRARLVPAARVTALLTADRRRSGSHYTPKAVTENVVSTTLAPLLGAEPTSEQILALRVCDPAMGTGAFLIAAGRYLAERLVQAEARGGRELAEPLARRWVAERCLYGVDRDGAAVEVARLSLWLFVGAPGLPSAAFERTLVHGEALLGAPGTTSERPGALDWERVFADVLGRGGFDAFVGNPPWVSYAGRAAQPLDPELRREYRRFAAFAGYRNLQGLFVERAARLLRAGGRLGFVLPSSMSELAGYAPTRRAHDALAEPDAELADLGNDAFEGVFQPCMVLASTRRSVPLACAGERPWSVERPDLDAFARALVEKLSRSPLPAELFGERGLQSMGEDRRYLKKQPDSAHSLPLRAGSDVEPFRLRPASFHADPAWFGGRLRASEEWRAVRLVLRQTARVPLAALSDGTAFRNSLLAGFEDESHPASFLVAYLNSSPIRWLHYVRHRDARQGMPQLKIGHLRKIPAPPSHELVAELARFGAELSGRARGITRDEQTWLDRAVADAFRLSADERARVDRDKMLWDVPDIAPDTSPGPSP